METNKFTNRIEKLYKSIENGRCHKLGIRVIEEDTTQIIVSFIDKAQQVLDVTSCTSPAACYKEILSYLINFSLMNNLFNSVTFCGGNGRFSYTIENVNNLK